ncbi:UDP-glucose:glycoprotein glucosyltransferase [Nannizzia gypsea CBS 118893]|uniref:UDP-glucose:glycoprotein glucosyltransferase n=1 Tax=Arthroderma gypseum (strain ATCC MYA-4604 / CBS 118893) TaxID=535722 RepID=E5R0E6_ARTGP|nr:UDP-glucose:glycoprotein glucosyltransferase [Nannizzia gypsea CBS 118893]EFQ97505.1 UDP-glucose:glycoprotein glucosyltransferase [Nannizzia gypsea CBS 118893]
MSPIRPWPIRPLSLFLASLALFPNVAQASPSVNVALSASFNSAPYLMELLETAAEENSTSYFPLLDRIADGRFVDAITEKDLYEQFIQVLSEDGHITDPVALSSFKFALSIRSTAPRIQAHYQYYNSSVENSLMAAQDAVCQVWAHYDGSQYCSPTLERAQQPLIAGRDESLEKLLPFDRVLAVPNGDDDESQQSLVLYADITSPLFSEFHKAVSKRARDGEITYRVRYRPSTIASGPSKPLFVSGYGVELSLKRTDYIMIDDRAEEKGGSTGSTSDSKPTLAADGLSGSPTADLEPLSSSEVSTLGLNAASFVLNSDDPFDTLIKLSDDFPRHSKTIAGVNATSEFLDEYRENREDGLQPGINTMWINGVQMSPRNIDAFSLLAHLRQERKLMNSLNELGLPVTEAVKLLSNPAIAMAQKVHGSQRFDYRDDIEGGGVIIWLNDLEKDPRYEGWSEDITTLLQPTYPGQFHELRRDVHNVVMPLDMADKEDITVFVEEIQAFVLNKVPIRFGLVPTQGSDLSKQQAKIAYYLLKTYGLESMFSYFPRGAYVHALDMLCSEILFPSKLDFEMAIKDKEPKDDQPTILSEDRLAADGENPPIYANAIPLERDERWVHFLIDKLFKDVQGMQQRIYEGEYKEDAWLPGFYLEEASPKRNALVIPEDPSDVTVKSINDAYSKHKEAFETIPRIPGNSESTIEKWAQLALVMDLDDEHGAKLLANAVVFHKMNPEVEILILHKPSTPAKEPGLSTELHSLLNGGRDLDTDAINALFDREAKRKGASADAQGFYSTIQPVIAELGADENCMHVLLNGRLIGPLNDTTILDVQDLELTLQYERSKRLVPVVKALESLKETEKIRDHLAFSRLTSMVALSTISDIPQGTFQSAPMIRTEIFNSWATKHSAITISNTEAPLVKIVATLDPATEIVQRWVPILKLLSELHGVSLKIFLTPLENIKELPVKRFYRHVLEATPSFHEDGSLKRPGASFHGLPQEALLNLGMDVPSSWLVAPKDSVHDLDNIKLSSLKEGTNVDAIYELEHILIEGHSRDMPKNKPPRGVQLLLGTERDPHFTDTIIMANLGYFQFKAQPGHWQITLKPGRSENIFNLDSVGGMGYTPKPGDDNNEVSLLSFQGKTLFPRLSRKPGHESDDVLEDGAKKQGSAKSILSQGLNFASGVFSGVAKTRKEKHADINIFSVASGHLYERMLNIMMLSVTKHTKHSVKFWFIEQFLSPSFKTFVPHLAEKYGFSYEMVTYKWPHWLRPQREKQREIWGYKILFLDVLFPLSLDKVIFVDADQIVRTDMYDLVSLDLEGAPYGFTPMCDSRTEIEGFRFWNQGYWKRFLRGRPYHISALYVVDLNRFRAIAAGDRLRGQYQSLSADPESLSNLDQDLPNHMQHSIPIKSLPQDWLWCETWCSDESLKTAKTIDLCNNPMTKEPKLDRARRQVPEWTVYDEEIAQLARTVGAKDVEAEHTAPKETEETEPEDANKDEL